MQAAEPDSTEAEVAESTRIKMKTRLGIESFSLSSTQTDRETSVAIDVNPMNFLGPLSIVFPGLSVVSHATKSY